MNSIKYQLSNTASWIWVALFELVFPRAPIRWMLLEVNADLKDFSIQNISTRLSASFWNSWLYWNRPEEGDIFIDGLYSNMDSQWIKLRLKNIIYKCWLVLNKTLIIKAWPILTNKITNLNAIVQMKTADSSTWLTNNTVSQTVSS